MEVLLLADITGIGKKSDLIVVQKGYALNHLLPARRAIVVTPSVRRRYAEEIKRRALEREQERVAQSESVKTLAGKKLDITVKTTKAGTLYAAVSEKVIADELKARFGIRLSPQQIRIQSPIKGVGTHSVGLLIGSATTQLSVEVKAAA